MWQLTRVGGLHRVLVLKCTVNGLTNTFDFEVILYVDRHSLDVISPALNFEFQFPLSKFSVSIQINYIN